MALRLVLAVTLTAAAAAPGVARADVSSPQLGEGSPVNVARSAAQRHFKRAQELYQLGSYRETIVELERAVALDPRAKDLHFNLGVVHEKLGRIDEALAAFRRYAELDPSPDERARVDKYVRRLEGAKTQLALQPAPTFLPAPREVVRAAPPPARGRVDALTIAATTVTVVGLGAGIFFAARAIAEKPSKNFVTGRDGSYQDLASQVESAHRTAVLADVGFAVALVSAGATAWLYFGRTKTVSAAATTALVRPPAFAPSVRTAAFAPSAGGGAIVLAGAF